MRFWIALGRLIAGRFDGIDGLIVDSRHALRLYLGAPVVTLLSFLSLTISLAFAGAFLSLYVDLALKPMPGFQQSHTLATVGQSGGPRLFGLPYRITERMSEEMNTIVAAAAATSLNVQIGDELSNSTATLVSEQFFDGIRPLIALGRGLRLEDHSRGSEPVMVISHSFWQERFEGDPGVLGSSMRLTRDQRNTYLPLGAEPDREATDFRIVGVTSKLLTGMADSSTDLWISMELGWPLFRGADVRADGILPETYVRKRDGVAATAVARELRDRYSSDGSMVGDFIPGVELDAVDGIVTDIELKKNTERQLQLFLIGSTLLVLVASANVCLFLLAKSPRRQREIGIRLSLGATVNRIARQFATEGGLLVLVSAAAGVLLSGWLSLYIRSLPFLRNANWSNVNLLDWRVLVCLFTLIVAVSLLAALVPVASIKSMSIGAASRISTSRPSLVQHIAGTVQIVAASIFCSCGIAIAWSFADLLHGDPGYEIADRHYVHFRGGQLLESDATLDAYAIDIARRRELIEGVPGVLAVGFGFPVPTARLDLASTTTIPRADDTARTVAANIGVYGPGFVDASGVRVLFGQAASNNVSGAPVVLVNQTLAREVWGREDVVGERLPTQFGARWSDAEVVGVVEDMGLPHPLATIKPWIMETLSPYLGWTAVVQTRLTAVELQVALDKLEAEGVLNASVSEVRSLKDLRADVLAEDRVRGMMAVVSAALVIVLAMAGYYSTQRYLVLSGRREYEIRAALGASPKSLGSLAILRAMLTGAPGLAMGGLLGFIAVASLPGELFSGKISPMLVSIGTLMCLCFSFVSASIVPAILATRARPARLLKEG